MMTASRLPSLQAEAAPLPGVVEQRQIGGRRRAFAAMLLISLNEDRQIYCAAATFAEKLRMRHDAQLPTDFQKELGAVLRWARCLAHPFGAKPRRRVSLTLRPGQRS
jgi:hypothetical protein